MIRVTRTLKLLRWGVRLLLLPLAIYWSGLAFFVCEAYWRGGHRAVDYKIEHLLRGIEIEHGYQMLLGDVLLAWLLREIHGGLSRLIRRRSAQPVTQPLARTARDPVP